MKVVLLLIRLTNIAVTLTFFIHVYKVGYKFSFPHLILFYIVFMIDLLMSYLYYMPVGIDGDTSEDDGEEDDDGDDPDGENDEQAENFRRRDRSKSDLGFLREPTGLN
jgi:hypothetical protein